MTMTVIKTTTKQKPVGYSLPGRGVSVLRLTTENSHPHGVTSPPLSAVILSAVPCDRRDMGGGWLRQLLRIP